MTDWFSLLHKSTIFYFLFTICHVNSCCTNCDILYDLRIFGKKNANRYSCVPVGSRDVQSSHKCHGSFN